MSNTSNSNKIEASQIVPDLTTLAEFIRQIRSNESETRESIRSAENQVRELIRIINGE